MAKKAADTFTINTRGRGGGYESNKDGGNRVSQFKRMSLRERCNENEERNTAMISTYKVDEGTIENELVILDDIDPTDPDLVWEDAILYDGLAVGNVGFNTIPSDDDPKSGIFCPIADMIRKNPHVRNVDYYIKFPQYGVCFTGIDRNEYEITKGERKGEMSGDSKRLVFITQRYINQLIRDIVTASKRAGITTLRGTVWHISRAECDRDKSIFTPKIGDRWDYVKQLTEDELLDTFENSAFDRNYDTAERFCKALNYEEVLDPPSVEEREEIAEMILAHCGGPKEKRGGGRRASSKGGSGSRSSSPRSARSSRGSRERTSSGSGRQGQSSGGRSERSSRSGSRAQARRRDYTKDEAPPAKANESGEGYFEDDDDVPF